MTLVIGRIIQNTIRIDSDSKITNPKIASNRNSIFSGLLKTIILNPNLCISYAGGVDYAQIAIEEIYKLKELSLTAVKDLLLRINRESDLETDFLIGSNGIQALLHKISNGEIQTSDQNHWIGDSAGFNIFQQNFVPSIKNNDPKHIAEMQSNAFEKTIETGNIESIGGFHVTVHNTRHGLEYLMKMSIQSGQSIKMKIKGNETVPLSFGDATTGAYSYCYLKSKNPHYPAIGIYFPMGNFGTLYYPRFTREISIIKNVDPFEFVEKVKSDFKIELTGMIKDGDFMRMI